MPKHDPIKAQAERRFVLTEESGEVIQALQKINRFTENSFGYDNVGDLEREIGQTLAILSLMVHCGDVDLDKINEAMLEKISEYKTENRLWHQEHNTLQSLNGLEVLFRGVVLKELKERGITDKPPLERIIHDSSGGVLLSYIAPESAFGKKLCIPRYTAFARILYKEKEDLFLVGLIWLRNLPSVVDKMPEMDMKHIDELELVVLNDLQALIEIPNTLTAVNGGATGQEVAQIVKQLRLAISKEIIQRRFC